MRDMLDAAGLDCCGCHLNLAAFEGDAFKRTVEFFGELNARHLTVGSVPVEMRNSRETLFDLAKVFTDLAGRLAPYGLDLAYHNHSE